MKKIFNNFAKPTGIIGKIVINIMNIFHIPFSKWIFSNLEIKEDYDILDLGCGGGKNIQSFLKLCPKGKVFGIDFSQESVNKSISLNKKYIKENKCLIFKQSVNEMVFEDDSFDIITAFDTVYFWKDIENVFFKINKFLKENGKFIIANEVNDEKISKYCENMKVYTNNELIELLKISGFEIEFIKNNNKMGWVLILARKI